MTGGIAPFIVPLVALDGGASFDSRMTVRLPIFVAATMAAPLAAQTAPPGNVRAQDQAVDAFGVRTGFEQIGLYTDTQVRGFSLQDAGNYRMNGAYFVRAGNLVDPILARVNTRVGVNGLSVDFPAPSGTVEYRLRTPENAPQFSADLTAREYGGFLAEGAVALGKGEDLALLAGGAINRARSSAGLENRAYRAGAVVEALPVTNVRLLGFASVNRFDLEGSYGVTAVGDRLPPRTPHPTRYTPAWADHDGRDLNVGAIVDWAPSSRLDLTASAIRSRLELPESDFVNLIVGEDGRGRASVIANRPRIANSVAGAIAATWRYAPGRRLYAELRGRETRNLFRSALALRVDDVDIGQPLPAVAEPVLTPAEPARDIVRQMTVGIGHELDTGRIRLKAGIQKTIYDRRFTPAVGPPDSMRSTPWLHDLSLLADLGGGLSGWAAMTRGLEEAGVAPGNAVNRNEVLPAVRVDQREFGLRWRNAGGLAVIGSAFRIEKPAAFIDPRGVFGLSGSLRHQGLELSVAGPVAPGLRILAGAALLDARRGGELVRAGATSAEPPGTSRLQTLVGLTWSVPGAPGLSIDGQLTRWSSRRVRSDRDLRAPAFGTLDIGALYAFRLGENDLSLRVRVVNLFDSDAWVSQRSELLDRLNRRGVRLTLSLRRS